jgi:hypothetical protein
MNVRAIFGINVLMTLTSAIVAATLFAWPRLRAASGGQALLWLVAPHMFLRFLGLSFLVPGVVSTSLPKAWAAPAAYGDFLTAMLAIIATVGLARTAPWAIALVWIFNVWGTADLLFAFYRGASVNLQPGSLGAGFYLITAIVPLLLVSHALIFALLLGPRH